MYSPALQMTKCGRIAGSEFDYSPAGVRASVLRSLERLQTTYLDTVYLHDIEFVATPCAPRTEGNHFGALGSEAHKYDLVTDAESNEPLPSTTSQCLPDEAAAYGLAPGDEGKVRGHGDEQILAAFAELRKLKSEGLVRRIGITGYPLPTLLRLAIPFALLPAHATSYELGHSLRLTRAKVVLVGKGLEGRVEQAGVQGVRVLQMERADSPNADRATSLDGLIDAYLIQPAISPPSSTASLPSSSLPPLLPPAPATPSTLAYLVLSSGTSGLPKAVS